MRTLTIVLVSAVLSGLAHPPLNLWWTLLVAPAVLFWVLRGKSVRAGFGWAWLWHTVYGLTLGWSLTYLIHLRTGNIALSVVGLVLVAGLSGCYAGVAGALTTRMPPNILGALGVAGIWSLFQWLRGIGDFAFVWGQMAPAFYKTPVLIQIADVVGAWGMDFLIAFWNALLGFMAGHAPARRSALVLGGMLWAGWLGYGLWSLPTQQAFQGEAEVRVAIVQPNVNLARHYTPAEWEPIQERIFDLVRRASESRPDIIALPEVIEPYPMPENGFAFARWQALASETRSVLIVGGYRIVDSETEQWANTAHLFLPDRRWLYHDKVQLVPLGEIVPYRRFLPFLAWFGVVPEDISSGERVEPLEAGALRIGAIICMESTYPWIARLLVVNGANLLWVGSNESWFGRTPALEQHLAFSVLRAVETRRWLVRCAPEGYSALIAPTGNFERVEPFVSTVVTKPVALRAEKTLYTQFGDWIIGLGAFGAILAWATGVRRHATQGVSDPQEAT